MPAVFTYLLSLGDPRGRLTRAGYLNHLLVGAAAVAAIFIVLGAAWTAVAWWAGYSFFLGWLAAAGVAALLAYALVGFATLKRGRDIGENGKFVGLFLLAAMSAGHADIYQQAYAAIAACYALVYLLVPSDMMRPEGPAVS